MSFLIENVGDLNVGDLNVAAPEGEHIVKMSRRVGNVYVANLGSIINWVLTDQLFPYAYNRGVGRISKKTM